MAPPIRLGISRCLLGDEVRYDGGHRRNELLLKALGSQVEWVPVCPEVEAGLGVPREPMQLVQSGPRSRVVTITTQEDRTELLEQFSARRIRELTELNLSGYVFKARSPSCGIHGVPLYDQDSTAKPIGFGVFALAFQHAFLHLPITQEDHLTDPAACERFLAQVYQYHQRFLADTEDIPITRAQPWNRTGDHTHDQSN